MKGTTGVQAASPCCHSCCAWMCSAHKPNLLPPQPETLLGRWQSQTQHSISQDNQQESSAGACYRKYTRSSLPSEATDEELKSSAGGTRRRSLSQGLGSCLLVSGRPARPYILPAVGAAPRAPSGTPSAQKAARLEKQQPHRSVWRGTASAQILTPHRSPRLDANRPRAAGRPAGRAGRFSCNFPPQIPETRKESPPVLARGRKTHAQRRWEHVFWLFVHQR